MIERVDANNKYQLFCSLNCLSLYRVNLQATSNQAVVCDHCRKFVPAQYHLTMSDASVRNFCSYQCVMAFQSQFAASSNKTSAPVNQTQQPPVKPPQQPVKQPPQHVKQPQQPHKPVQQVKNAPVTRNATRGNHVCWQDFCVHLHLHSCVHYLFLKIFLYAKVTVLKLDDFLGDLFQQRGNFWLPLILWYNNMKTSDLH